MRQNTITSRRAGDGPAFPRPADDQAVPSMGGELYRAGCIMLIVGQSKERDPQHWLDLAAEAKARAETLSRNGAAKAWELVEELVDIAYLVADEKIGRDTLGGAAPVKCPLP